MRSITSQGRISTKHRCVFSVMVSGDSSKPFRIHHVIYTQPFQAERMKNCDRVRSVLLGWKGCQGKKEFRQTGSMLTLRTQLNASIVVSISSI